MKLLKLPADQAWKHVFEFVKKTSFCKSIGSKAITYQLKYIENQIHFNCLTRNDGNDEIVSKEMFIEFYESILKIETVNTNTIKTLVPNSLYRMRSPMIALLKACGLLQNS
jgi:hypothetical protein